MLPFRAARAAPRTPARPWHARGSLASSRPSAAAVRCRQRACSSSSSSPPLPRPPADHRDLGLRQELFATSVYSPGSPILLPNGTRVFNRLVEFLRRQYVHYGFQEVITPTIYKKALWARSGHLENYADDMYTVTSASSRAAQAAAAEDGGPAGDGDEYGLKPMNCPGHCLIFASQRRSYRDLPIRYADFSPLHRDEASGSLSGLTRVRRFHQDDGHIFCRPSQIEHEIRQTLDFVRRTYGVFGLGPYRLVLSTRPADHYIGTLEEWAQAEAALRSALDRSGQPWALNEGDGAFYGPKIDVVLRGSDGKEHQTATIQLDFQLPKRFELEYQAPPAPGPGETGAARPVLIHRAVLGSVERLMALLIEHYAGKWPLWLNPRQGIVLTVNDSEAVVAFARQTRDILAGTVDGSDANFRPSGLVIDVDDSPRTLPLKVREAKSKGYGVIVVVGPKDLAKGTVAVDASGIPAGRAPPSGDEAPRPRSAEMRPDELKAFMKCTVDSYQ